MKKIIKVCITVLVVLFMLFVLLNVANAIYLAFFS